MRKMTLIMAHASDGAIGYKGGLPWPHHAEDMKRFREATLGKALIMGRTTWESLPCPLKYRHNIVVTSCPGKIDRSLADPVKSIEEAIKVADGEDIFFIGGKMLYSQCLAYVNHYLLTEIHGKWPADTYFKVPFLKEKRLVSQELWEHPDDPDLNCTFSEYVNEGV